MKFRIVHRTGLAASCSPYRVVDEQDSDLPWANHFPDMQCVRGLAPLSLRSYGLAILHFVRWWSGQPGVDVTCFTAGQFTEATLVDYVRAQLDQLPKLSPVSVNNRSSMLRRLFRFHFQQDMPHGPYRLQSTWFRRSPLGYGRGRQATAADLTLKVPQRVVVPLHRTSGSFLAKLSHGPRSGHHRFNVAQWPALARGAGAQAGRSAVQ